MERTAPRQPHRYKLEQEDLTRMNKLLDFDASQFKDIPESLRLGVGMSLERDPYDHDDPLIPEHPLGRGKASVGKGG